MKKIFCLSVSFLFIFGCVRSGGPGRPSQMAVAHTVRTYVLGRVPDQEREQAFQDLLGTAHATALKNSGGAAEIGFSYSMSPKGAVYTFSEVEVSCLIKKSDASQGRKLCSDFFKTVDAGFKKIIDR